MQFHDLGAQYRALKAEIDAGIAAVLEKGHFILGEQVSELEDALARDVGRRHCVTCGNGTDALVLALMLWGVGRPAKIVDFRMLSHGIRHTSYVIVSGA